MDEGTLEQINSHINLPITKDEIFKCVQINMAIDLL
jgi:hypothetical protein